jgi:hypothetical protein
VGVGALSFADREEEEMRKALIPALLLVLLSMVLGATVFRDQAAQAAQAILPVKVTNSALEPVPVSGTVAIDGSVQVGEREPFQETQFFNQTPDTCTQFVCDVTFATVPEGKRLVVTYASARYALSSGGTVPSVRVSNGGGFDEESILLPAPVRIGFDSYVASGPVTFYVDAGDDPTLSLGGQFVLPTSNTAHASIVGYFVPAS